MSDLFPAYCELISSPAQLARCQEATSVSELLSVIKSLWQQTALSDDQLIAELVQLNQQIIDGDKIQLAGHWLPYRYHAKSRSIHWCLPAGHATEPFQDETISRYRQTVLLNQFITPKTALTSLDIQAKAVQSITPAGFIFHLSRCGSTLISGCLSELDTSCVFSESPVLTDILLDRELGKTAQQQYLQQLIDLQASVFPSRPHVVIKWNAWDIFRWDLIRAIYPQVPCIFLVRNPVEILASHQRSAGRHMSGDPTLAGVHLVFNKNQVVPVSLLDFRIDVLKELLAEIQLIGAGSSVCRVDYHQLDLDKLSEICTYFRIPFTSKEVSRIKSRLGFHSKSPMLRFNEDGVEKQKLFSPMDVKRIEQILLPLYNQFSKNN
ncbi:MAG TPA: sulfotransferase family protein [Cellvibrio sp.]|nr:sulfotransferase family protein [Cellvibrio sp.]